MTKKISSKIEKLLWTTDFSKESRFCLPYMKALYDVFKTENTALFVLPKFSDWIYETAFFTDEELLKTVARTKQESIDKIVDFSEKANIPFTAEVIDGIESEEIIRYADEKDVDMIFAGRRGISEIEHILIGSTTSRLIRNSDIPVFVVPRENKDAKIVKILAPIDLSQSTLIELKYAITLARRLKAKLFVVHVSEFFNYKVPVLKRDQLRGEINKKINSIASRADYKIENIIYETGEPAQKIIEVSRNNQIDLVIMSTHQRKGLVRQFLGSITEKVLMYSDTPVLVLPPRDYDFS